MKISDLVAQTIIEMIDNDNGMAELQRNELASLLGCVPSQINYVITSRFTPEHGYKVESRRGSGGYIKITRVSMDKGTALMHTVNSVGDVISGASARAMIINLNQRGLISAEASKIMLSVISDNALCDISADARDIVRATLLKQMLVSIL